MHSADLETELAKILAKEITKEIDEQLIADILANCHPARFELKDPIERALDQNVTLLYQPVVKAAHGTGELYLATARGESWEGKPGSIQWVIGKVRDSRSGEEGKVCLPLIATSTTTGSSTLHLSAKMAIFFAVRASPSLT